MKNIDSTEQEYLIKQKLEEGKGLIQTEKEVKRDIRFIKDQNKLKIELQKEIKKLEKEKAKINKQFKREFERLKKVQIPDDEFKKRKTTLKSATTKHLNRIIYYLEENPEKNVTAIAKDNCMTSTYASDGLNFLLKRNLIEGTKQPNGVMRYKLR